MLAFELQSYVWEAWITIQFCVNENLSIHKSVWARERVFTRVACLSLLPIWRTLLNQESQKRLLFPFKIAWRIHGFKFSVQVFVRLSFGRHWQENVSSDQKSRTCTLYRFTLIVMPNRVKDADINDITADSRLLCLLIQLEIRYLM